MKHLFVPYELAKKLQEKGFNIPCLAQWLENGGEAIGTAEFQYPLRYDNGDRIVRAPLYQQVIDWFREEHKVRICDFTDSGETTVTGFVIFSRDKNTRAYLETRVSGMDYYEAFSKAIEQALSLI